VGKLPVVVDADCVDLLSFSAHKIYGPKGCGALFVRQKPRIDLTCQLDGGGHETGYRSGTLNVPGIVGLGMACEIAAQRMASDIPRLRILRDRLEHGVQQLGGVRVNGDPDHRLEHMTNLSFDGLAADWPLSIENIAVSAGSACTSASLDPSYVLTACGIRRELAFASLRYSLGRYTTDAEINLAIEATIAAIRSARELLRATAPSPR